ncbi:hypothetical protein AMJ57_02550 [Parcubacteria bacterium SG8_24]|nr:MAG: hypothetical protein AMJ57_02550 [Parcubacteria bacterium SG8_24]
MSRQTGNRTDWGAALVSLAIVALVAAAIWYTHSLWALLGLFFLFSTRGCSCPKVPPNCPKCGHQLYKRDEDEGGD